MHSCNYYPNFVKCKIKKTYFYNFYFYFEDKGLMMPLDMKGCPSHAVDAEGGVGGISVAILGKYVLPQ